MEELIRFVTTLYPRVVPPGAEELLLVSITQLPRSLGREPKRRLLKLRTYLH